MNRRPLFSARRAMALALLYALPATALAKDVAIAPFIPVGGVDPKVATNITSVIASEIEFMSEFDSAEQLTAMPAALNAACLAKTSCLKTVGTSTGKDQLIVGSVAPAGGDSYDIFMLLFDVPTGSVVNKKTITLAKSDFADKMGKQVRGLVTGDGAQDAAQKAPVAANTFSDSEDEFEFAAPASNKNLPTVNTPGNSNASLDDYEAESAQEAAARKKAEEAARKKAADDATRKAAEDAARKQAAEEEARRVAEADARRKAEEEARRRAEEEARRVAEAEARRRAEQEASARTSQANVALDDITFGDVDPAEVEVDISDIEFGRAEVVVDEYPSRSSSSSSSSTTRPSSSTTSSSSSSASRSAPSSSTSRSSTSPSSRPSSSSSSSSRAIDDEIAALDGEDDEDERFVDLDELDEEPRSSTKSSSSSSKPSSSSSSSSKSSSSSSKNVEIKGTVDKKDQPRFGLTLRAGGSKFQELNFVTYGGELSVPVAPRGYINIGLEGWTTRRDVPERLQEIYGSSVYNTIPPLTFGASFQGNSHNARPFIGGDLTLAPYTSSFKTAVGARVRFGSDFMVSDSFGFNLSANAGALYGAELDQVQAGMKPLAPVIQASAGTIIRF